MKKILLAVFLFIGFTFISAQFTPSEAVYVNGYYRSNGTYVQPYYRSAPNGLKYDNYSYRSGQSSYNPSYYTCCKSSNWYTPSYTWQSDYWSGYNSYRSNNYDW